MSDKSKTRIFKSPHRRNFVYQVGQGCPIKAKIEFSNPQPTQHCLSSRTGRPIKAKREFSKKILVGFGKYTTYFPKPTVPRGIEPLLVE